MRLYKLKEEKQNENIKVYINNELACVYECYVSKDPINRRWPGHQREENQRETAYFTSFESDSKVNVKIEKYKKGSAIVRPVSKNINVLDKNEYFEFELNKEGSYSFEIGDYHENIHIFFNEPKIYDIPNDTLIFKNGNFDLGEIILKDNQTIYIDETAVVYGNIYAENVSNIKIIGRGIFDNSKSKEEILFEAKQGKLQVDVGNAKRKHCMAIRHSRNITIDGVIIRDSLMYTIACLDCEDVSVNNVKIIGNWRYNSDGIDLQNTRNAIITNCFIRTYDDCICIKGEKECGKNCENTLYDNCVLWCDWGHSFEIGYETCAKEIKNITYKNCVSLRTNFDFINIGCVDYADIHNITYENIVLEYTGDERKPQFQEQDKELYLYNNDEFYPETFGLGVFHHFEYSVGNEFGKIHDILFKNIKIINGKNIRVHIKGADQEHKVSNITFENIIINGKKIENTMELIGELEFTDNIIVK